MGNVINISALQRLLDGHRAEFETYRSLLIKWNKIHNLTAITDPGEIWNKHFLDSLTPLPFLSESATLLDIGSGAGFPGIPLKIVHPSLFVTLLEATQKKCNFCEKIIQELGLTNIKVVHGRAEDRKTLPDKFNIVISRATTSLKQFIDYGAPYLKNESSALIAMKGKISIEEINNANTSLLKYHLTISSQENYLLTSTSSVRNIIVVSVS